MNTNDQAKMAQCPHCQSTFIASQEEMQLALGAVRCGECMKIFNASYHYLAEANAKTANQLVSSTAVNGLSIDQEQIDNIPTLHDYHNQPIYSNSTTNSPSLDDTEADPYFFDEEQATAETEQDQSFYDENQLAADPDLTKTQPKQAKKLNLTAISGLVFIIIALLIGSGFIINKTPTVNYEFTDIRLVPSTSLRTLDVHFNLKNISEQTLPLPDLNIELLNLSSQAVSSTLISATNLNLDLTQLQAASSHPLTVTLKLPTTFVQTARIQPHLNNPKL